MNTMHCALLICLFSYTFNTATSEEFPQRDQDALFLLNKQFLKQAESLRRERNQTQKRMRRLALETERRRAVDALPPGTLEKYVRELEERVTQPRKSFNGTEATLTRKQEI